MRALRSGGHLILGLRPELLAPAASHAAGSVLELPVTLVEALGPHLLVHLEAEGAGLQLADTGRALRAGVREVTDDPGPAIFSRPAATLTARLPPHTRVQQGQRLRLFVDLERAHFFDPTTQCALR
jgi:multiple sugar transport system ATP-binding protein